MCNLTRTVDELCTGIRVALTATACRFLRALGEEMSLLTEDEELGLPFTICRVNADSVGGCKCDGIRRLLNCGEKLTSCCNQWYSKSNFLFLNKNITELNIYQ